ncbi:hypothetical protein WK23_21145 [Burkholderia vietnamiensis]|nr:hypothetical protein WK23_21145 [Burkholderia vietnamiensis]
MGYRLSDSARHWIMLMALVLLCQVCKGWVNGQGSSLQLLLHLTTNNNLLLGIRATGTGVLPVR